MGAVQVLKDKLMWKYLNGEEEMDGDFESVQESVADKVLAREEMELEVWSKDKNQNSFVAVTRPVLWQDFVHSQELTQHEFNIYRKDNQKEKIGTLTFQSLFTLTELPIVLIKKKFKPLYYK